MKKIEFTKTVASGNDFVIVPLSNDRIVRLSELAKKICNRKYGIGADGLLVIEKSRVAHARMRIFNSDGSEAEMCGNGARSAALYLRSQMQINQSEIKIETKAGIIISQINKDKIKIKLTEPKDIKLNIPVKINNRILRVNFINTGVPHVVIFVEGLDKIEIVNLGRKIRFHKKFRPEGTNVNFVEILDNDSIRLRTYERGVEDETFACGTGTVASAIITSLQLSNFSSQIIKAETKSGEILKVYFKREGNNFKDIWLEGKVKIICKGEYLI